MSILVKRKKEEERSPYAFISSSETHNFMKIFVGNSDTEIRSEAWGGVISWGP